MVLRRLPINPRGYRIQTDPEKVENWNFNLCRLECKACFVLLLLWLKKRGELSSVNGRYMVQLAAV